MVFWRGKLKIFPFHVKIGNWLALSMKWVVLMSTLKMFSVEKTDFLNPLRGFRSLLKSDLLVIHFYLILRSKKSNSLLHKNTLDATNFGLMFFKQREKPKTALNV